MISWKIDHLYQLRPRQVMWLLVVEELLELDPPAQLQCTNHHRIVLHLQECQVVEHLIQDLEYHLVYQHLHLNIVQLVVWLHQE